MEKRMKTEHRLIWIRLLMIVSQVILTLFLAQWITSVFVKERDRFNSECETKFMESQVAVLDSLLAEKMVVPALKDSSYRKLTMNITLDSCRVKQNTAVMTVISNENLILRGMKMFVDRMEDSLTLPEGSIMKTVIRQDTGMLKEVFAQNIRSVDPAITLSWVTDTTPADSTGPGNLRFRYVTHATDYSMAAVVRHPFLFILKEIYPSLLFALALLVLTGLSFIISFRSLKKQILLNRLRNEFTSHVTHELKTPVSTVKVALEALRNFNPEQDPLLIAEYLEMASKEADRLEKLVNQVLHSTVYNNGIRLTGKDSIDLGMMVAEVVRTFQPRLNEQGASVNIGNRGEAITILADRLHLQGVIANLIDNSLKYGGEKPRIDIGMEKRGEEVMLSVTDNGPGIPAEYLDRIFDNFFRVPTGDLHNVKGYGLGLSYAAMVMRLHGGTIRAENLPEGGVRFILTFHPGR